MPRRPQKTIRLNYHMPDPDYAANITVFGEPAEVRMASSPDTFVSIRKNGLSFSGSFPSKINIQGMSNSMKYAGGMIQDLPFPMALIPVTLATPFPKQIIIPPFNEILGTVRTLSQYASLLPK